MKSTATFGFQEHPPYALNISEQSESPGLDLELIRLFCTYDTVYECRFKNSLGKLHQISRQLTNGDFDMAVPLHVINEDFLNNGTFTFSNVVRESTMLFVTRQPETDVSSLSPFSSFVFHWTVWLSLIAVSIVLGVFVELTNNTKYGSYSIDWIRSSVDVFSFLTGQSGISQSKTRNAKTLMAFWGVTTVILAGIYSGNLWSSLIRNTAKLPFDDLNSLAKCVEAHKCSLAFSPLDERHPVVRAIFNKSQPTYQLLRRALAKNPPIRRDTPELVLTQIAKDKRRYLVTIKPYENYMQETESNRLCMFVWVPFMATPLGYPALKRSPVLRRLNSFIERYRSSGLPDFYWNKYIRKEAVCDIPEINVLKQSIDAIQFFSCLFVLLIGSGLGTLIFSVEVIIAKRFEKMRLSAPFLQNDKDDVCEVLRKDTFKR